MSDPIELFNQLGQVQDAATKAGIRPDLYASLVRQESNFNPAARSPKGAMGYAQLMPATAQELGVDPNDPLQNLEGGARYFKQLLDHYKGDERLALAAYNAGMGNVDKAGGIPNFPETQNYVNTVHGRAQSNDPIAVFNSLPAAPQEPSFFDNVGTSATNYAEGIGHAIAHPIETGDNLLRLAGGALQLIGPERLKRDFGGDYTPQARAVGRFYKDRYGSWDRIKHTAFTDPVGMLSDASIAIPILGETVGVGSKAAGLGKIAGAARMVSKAGRMLDPLTAAGEAAGAVLPKAAERIIASNVKPSDSLVLKNPGINIPRVILDEGFGPGSRGAKKAARVTGESKAAGDALIAANGGKMANVQPVMDVLDQQAATVAGARTPTEAAAGRAIGRTKRQLLDSSWGEDVFATQQVPVTVQVPTGAVDNAGNPIMQTQTIMQPQQVKVGRRLQPQQSVSEIDNFKKTIQADNKTAYGQFDPRPGAQVRAEKAMGGVARKLLEDAIPGKPGTFFRKAEPGLAEVNQRTARLTVATKALKKMAKNEANKLPIGLMDLVALSPNRNPLLAPLLLKHPTTAFPIARGIDKVGKVAPTLSRATAVGSRASQGRPVTKAEVEDTYARIAALRADD